MTGFLTGVFLAVLPVGMCTYIAVGLMAPFIRPQRKQPPMPSQPNFYRPPRKGQTVKLTFEGVVQDTDLHMIRLRHESIPAGVTVSWGANARPEVEVTDQGFAKGDIGVYTSPRGGVCTVAYQPRGEGLSDGWYGIVDTEYKANSYSDRVRPVLRHDGTLFE